jgi:thioredoxin reductase (NADPH)
VLCTTGVSWRRLATPGIERLLHAGIYYGAATSEAPGVQGEDVFIIGGGNSAGQAAMNFAGLARSVTILVRGEGLAASMSSYLTRRIDAAPNITVRIRTEVAAVDGDEWLRSVTLRDMRTGDCRVTLSGIDAGITARPAPGTRARRNVGHSAEGRGFALHGTQGSCRPGTVSLAELVPCSSRCILAPADNCFYNLDSLNEREAHRREDAR